MGQSRNTFVSVTHSKSWVIRLRPSFYVSGKKAYVEPIDLLGKSFGDLSVMSTAPHIQRPGGTQSTAWKCVCSCGVYVIVATTWLRSGNKTSCGCKNFTRPHGNRKRNAKESSFIALFGRMQNSAKAREIEWDLPFDAWLRLTQENCHWCGSAPFETFNMAIAKSGYTQRKFQSEAVMDGWITYNGLDRKDSLGIYTEENCFPSCKWCNFARNTMSMDEFREWIRKVASFALGMY